ncbi:ATP-dependent DNA helicase PIF1-like protein [Tanacetum coccineum]|uniref:ATP-dependent DNA helicase PIF1-like protein n=1 Tax=Tanacetum coccineum TaxID=301880 RepID=A0ABQ5GGT9_9ASTR
MIVDDEQIPVLKQFKSDDSGIEIAKELLLADRTGAKAGTLENLLMWARCNLSLCRKGRTKRGWNYPSCGGEKCKKGNLDRKHGRFWCDSCHSSVDYPVLRLELEVSDDTAQTVVVMFDETARAVVKCSAGSIDEEETGLPPVLANIALDESGNFGTLAGIGEPKVGVLVPLTTTPSVSTPSKPGEPKKAQRFSSKERTTIPMVRNQLLAE